MSGSKSYDTQKVYPDLVIYCINAQSGMSNNSKKSEGL